MCVHRALSASGGHPLSAPAHRARRRARRPRSLLYIINICPRSPAPRRRSNNKTHNASVARGTQLIFIRTLYVFRTLHAAQNTAPRIVQAAAHHKNINTTHNAALAHKTTQLLGRTLDICSARAQRRNTHHSCVCCGLLFIQIICVCRSSYRSPRCWRWFIVVKTCLFY